MGPHRLAFLCRWQLKLKLWEDDSLRAFCKTVPMWYRNSTTISSSVVQDEAVPVSTIACSRAIDQNLSSCCIKFSGDDFFKNNQPIANCVRARSFFFFLCWGTVHGPERSSQGIMDNHFIWSYFSQNKKKKVLLKALNFWYVLLYLWNTIIFFAYGLWILFLDLSVLCAELHMEWTSLRSMQLHVD